MLDFYIEVLPGAEGVVFGGDFFVGDDDGKIFDGFLGIEDANDLVFFVGGEEGFLVFAVFDLGAEIGGIDEHDVFFVRGIEEENGDVGAGGGEDVAGHGDHTSEHFVFHEVLADFFLDAGLGGDEASGDDDGGFAFFREGVDDVLDEEQVDGHFVLVLVRHLGDAGEEALAVRLGIEFLAVVGEIELEGWIGDDDIELAQGAALVLVVGMEDGVALDDLGDGVDEVIEDEIEAQQAGGFLRDVLGKDGAAILADGVGHGHEQSAGACGGVVASDVFHGAGDEAGGHDFRDGVGGVVFGVLAAAVFVVVLDEILEEGGEEVEFFREDVLEREVHDFVDDGAGELISLRGDELGDGIEEGDFLAVFGFHGEDFGIERGDGK